MSSAKLAKNNKNDKEILIKNHLNKCEFLYFKYIISYFLKLKFFIYIFYY